MYRKAMDHCARLGFWPVVLYGMLLAVAIESFTMWTRFGLGLQSTRDTTLVARVSLGIRIHHGYVGLLILFVAWAFFNRHPGLCKALSMIALALVFSDLAHHFLVLWPITGDPQFDLVYPKPG